MPFNKNTIKASSGLPVMATKVTQMKAPKVGKFAKAVKSFQAKAKAPIGKGKTKGIGAKGASGKVV